MKKWYASKTLWVNLIAVVALGVQAVKSDWVISPEIQASILAGINVLLRLITKEQIIWS